MCSLGIEHYSFYYGCYLFIKVHKEHTVQSVLGTYGGFWLCYMTHLFVNNDILSIKIVLMPT